VAVATLALAGAAHAAFPADPPDDPQYAPAETGTPATCATTSGDDQEHYLFSFIPQCTPNAVDPEGSAGMSLDAAWRQYTDGDPGTVIAYIEGGINWRDQPTELADKVFLNKGELPAPTTPVDDGALNAKDYADTPDSNGNGLVDPEDIIVRFSDGRDDDRNGYTDDISGWDFYNDQNDPATVDSEYRHANSQMRQAGAETNNAIGEAGVCPRCMILPIKAGAEALDRGDDLAQAWLYASDMNADVLVSVTADLGYTSFMRQAVERVWDRGTVMVESSNDFNSIDHQGSMFWPHVLPGNGLVANTHGLDIAPGSAATQNQLTTTYRARSAYTSWGTHNMFSAATTGGTTSESTPTIGGVMAMVLSYGKQAARQGLIDHPLTPDEAVQVVRATASDIAENPNPPLGWPAKPGWDLQYGYGRPNVLKAMKAIEAGDIPPEAWIDKPRWYSLFDPRHAKKVKVSGHVAAPRADGYRYVVEFAPGAEPTDADFRRAGRGHATTPIDGKLATINLKRVRKRFWRQAFHLSQSKTLETNDQYTVTIRLRVFDANGRMAEERRAIAVHHDPTLRHGFPRFIGTGGESQPALADLQGTGHEAIVFGDADGRVHALSPRGKELPGFPVTTKRTRVERPHRGIDPGHEPIVSNVAVGDLKHNGRQEIVATSTTGRVYVFDARGHLIRGWPKRLDTGVHKPAIPRPAQPFTRPATMGAVSPPVLADLDDDGNLQIVQAGWDGYLHAWHASGKRVKGWPFQVTLPPGVSPPDGEVAINDQKLDLSPTIAQLDDDPEPELVQRTQYSFANGPDLQFPNGGQSNIVAYNSDGSRVDGFLISNTALAFYYGSAQEFITEGTNNPSAADVDGDGRTELTSASGIFSPTTLYNADGSQRTAYAPVANPLAAVGGGSLAGLVGLLNGQTPTDTPVNFTTSGAFGRFGDQLAFVEPGTGITVAGSLLLPGSGLPINNYMRGFNAASGAPIAGMPAASQGLDFLGAPAVADVDGDGAAEVIEGGDSSALHAFAAGGSQAARFPKFQTGWILWGPSVGDLDGNGRNEVVAATREGYIMVWNTRGKAAGNDEWWSYRHDERNTGLYGNDTRPPGTLRRARVKAGVLRFRAPADDWYSGSRPDHYVVSVGSGGHAKRLRVDATAKPGGVQRIRLPHVRATSIRAWAVDDAGNRGATVRPKRP
jgi:hypothetical protein